MVLPTDNYIVARNTTEAERLNLQHEYMLSCQGYYLHPDIPTPTTGTRIADLCTGTAIFLCDTGQAYPTAECHGFDISDKMYPPAGSLPANVELHLADVKQPFEGRWLGYFDVVHLRFIEAAMRKEDWATTLRNIVTLLRPGGWLQWVEDDRAHSVRHAARPVAPSGAARESLGVAAGQSRFSPPKIVFLDSFSRMLMPNIRADDMTYGYMNLDALMKDPGVGNLEQVGCDVFAIDRDDDGGQLRRDWAGTGIAGVSSMLKSREDAGERLTELSREDIAEGFLKDIAAGGHFLTRASVFTGMKKA